MRPEGWEKQYPNPCTDCDHNTKYQSWDIRRGSRCDLCIRDDVYDQFEAGADAYEKALKKGGVLVKTLDYIIEIEGETVVPKHSAGRVVFIEDDDVT